MESPTRCDLRRAAEELARCLLPPLFARLNEARGKFLDLARRIEGDPEGWIGDEELLAQADALGGSDRPMGWCLGVLAAAVGADLLGVRREREGLRHFAALVAEGRGFRLEPAPSQLPRVATGVGEGWELPLAVAYFFLRAAQAQGADKVLRWRLERSAGCWVFVCHGAPPLADPGATWRAILDRIPGAFLSREDAEHTALVVPDPWIDDENEDHDEDVQ